LLCCKAVAIATTIARRGSPRHCVTATMSTVLPVCASSNPATAGGGGVGSAGREAYAPEDAAAVHRRVERGAAR